MHRAPSAMGAWLRLLVRPSTVTIDNLFWPPTSRNVLWAVVTIAAIGAVMLAVDVWAITQARALPAWLVAFFQAVTDFGRSGRFLIPSGIVLLCILLATQFAASRFTRLVLSALALRAAFIFLAVACPMLVGNAIKTVIGRARPFVSEEAAPFVNAWISFQDTYRSFPSGHTISAFSAAFAIAALWPRARPFAFVYAAIIALSRVIVTAHHPSDVLAGAILGTAGALLVRNWFAARRLVFVIGDDEILRPRPGPSLRRVATLTQRIIGC
jgi:undecaprenyl-diphosphatase